MVQCALITARMACVRVAVLLLLCTAAVQSEYLFKKFCDDVSPHMCDVSNVILEPCSDGRKFCTIKRTKRYTLTIDFVPKFAAKKLNISILADDDNDGTYDKVVKGSTDACDYLTCPVKDQMRRVFDVDFSLGKSFAVGKFPVKIKLYNSEDANETCCFTFNVKTSK